MFTGRNRSEGVGVIPALCSQVLAGAAGVHGAQSGQDLRHGRSQGRHVPGAAPRPARPARAARAQRGQLARGPRAAPGREHVPPLQERRAAHQVSLTATAPAPPEH